jgi:hypothetical protein
LSEALNKKALLKQGLYLQEINLAKSNGSGTLVPHSPGEDKATLSGCL